MQPRLAATALQDPVSGLLTITIQSFLIRQDGLTILVDSCSGNDKEARARPEFRRAKWPWLERFADAGVKPEDIDIVLCSHLHVDHVGWNTRLYNGHWVPTFPNARYLISRREWDHWQAAGAAALSRTGDYITDSVLPCLPPGRPSSLPTSMRSRRRFRSSPRPGTHAGQMMVRVGAGREQAMLCAD